MAEKKYASTAAISELWDNTKAYVPNAVDETDVADMLEELGLDGIRPTGTKQISITANGTTTEDVTNYANAEINVNVQSSEDIFDLSKPTGAHTTNLTTIPAYAGYGRTGITSIDAPNATRINNYAFSAMTNLVSFACPNTGMLGARIFQGDTKLTTYNAPYLYFNNNDNNFFQGCTSLAGVVLKNCSQARWFGYGDAFSGCTNLTYVDATGTAEEIRPSTFLNTKLSVLILRKTNTGDIILANINAFNGTPFASGGAGGTIYVPSDFVSTMRNATNWSTILANNSNNQILPIEGSIYETQYADGTTIPQS